MDVYLNGRAFWRNVPLPVWCYKLGRCQALKKWLSYRKQGVLGQVPRVKEVLHFAGVAKRIEGVRVGEAEK